MQKPDPIAASSATGPRHFAVLTRAVQGMHAALTLADVMRQAVRFACELVPSETGAWGVGSASKITWQEYFDGQVWRHAAERQPPQVDAHGSIHVSVISDAGVFLACLEVHRGSPYDDNERELLQCLGALAATALAAQALLARAEQARVEAQTAHDHAQFFADAGTTLATTLDLTATLARLAALVVPRLADWSTVSVTMDEATPMRRIAVEHGDPSKQALVERYMAEFPPGSHQPTGIFAKVGAGEALLLPRISQDDLRNVAQTPQHAATMHALGLTSCIMVPMMLRNTCLGVLSLCRGANSPPYTRSDLVVAKELAGRAALAIENARLYERERAARAEAETLVAELSRQRQWLEDLLDLLPITVLMVDTAEGRMVFANKAADAMAGGTFPRSQNATEFATHYQLTDLEGNPVPLEQMPSSRAAHGETLRGLQLRWHMPHATRTILLHAQRLPARRGERPLVVLAIDDITALEAAQHALEAAVKSREDFLSVAAHELRTPLTPLKLHIQGLQRALQSGNTDALRPDRLQPKVDMIARQSARLATLVEHLLDLSRMQSGRLELQLEDGVDLHALTVDLVSRFEHEASRSGCVIRVHQTPPVIGVCDRLRVEQVLTNLLVNAMKYGRGQAIDVTLQSTDSDIEIAVRDRGIGIAPDDATRVFERFERAVPSKNYGGLGLGLWIVRELLTAMGGSIVLQSVVAEGSTFTVRLPRYRPTSC